MVKTRQSTKREMEQNNKPPEKKEENKEEKKDIKQKPTKKVFSDVLHKLKIDESFTRVKKRQRKYNKFVNNMNTDPEYNYQADLLELPTTKKQFKWLLVMVDIATKLFDVEPMINKEASTTLQAMKNIFTRKPNILKLPYSSITTDNGGEFKSDFNKYLHDNKILHLFALPYRHKQMSMVESLNKQLSRILLTYCNEKTIEEGLEEYNEWTDILPEIRTELNDYRERDPKKIKQPSFDPTKEPQTYKVGDLVHYKLERPYSVLNNPEKDGKFRMGDIRFSKAVHKIKKVVYMNDSPYYRYILTDMPNVSYSEHELIPNTTKHQEEMRLVRKIIGKKTEKRIPYYLVWWKNELKKNATYEPKSKLIEDGLEDEIKEFEREYNRSMAKKRKKRNG